MSTIKPIIEVELPSGDVLPVVRRRFQGSTPGPRVSIVAGIRGDAPEGIRVVHQVAELLESAEDHLKT